MNEDISYKSIELKRLFPDEPLGTDIYLKIGQKFIRFKYEKDVIPSEKVNYFFSKNVSEIYIESNKFELFESWIESVKKSKEDEFVAEVGEENRHIVKKREEIKESVFDAFAKEEITEEMAKQLQEQAQDFVKEVSGKDFPKAVIAKLTRNSESVAEHSVNVANIAVFISLLLGFENKTLIRNIFLGAIFHDYGKSKISEDILLNPSHPRYVQSIESHPERSVEILKNMKTVPPQVLEMVHQHHEMFNGKGFPKGLAGNDISEYSKILSIANEFDNAIAKGERTSTTYKKAFKLLEYDKGAKFDPEMLKLIMPGLLKAFDSYEENNDEEGIYI